MKNILIVFYSIFILTFSVQADESLTLIKQKLEKIERDITDLQKIIFTKKDVQLTNNTETENQNSSITVFDMRLRDIENELQAINLNYENISFEIEDLKKFLEELSFELNNAIITINSRIAGINNINIENLNVPESNKSEEKNTLGTLKISSNNLSNSNNVDKSEEKI